MYFLISSETGAGPVWLYENTYLYMTELQLVNITLHENYIGLDTKGTHIDEHCNRICIP